jgi:CrcB protein
MNAFVLVGLGGAIGAMARYGAGVLVGRLWFNPFPLATLGVNMLGSLAMGLLVGALARYTPGWQAEARLFLAVGVLGGFTTFSSFSLDTIALLERGEPVQAAAYVALSVMVSIAALAFGLWAMRGVTA